MLKLKCHMCCKGKGIEHLSLFLIIIYLKIKSYIQLKIHKVSIPVVHVIHGTTEITRSLQGIYNKDLISYIKMLFKRKSNP